MPKIRLPLLNTAEFRSSDTSKDSVIVNGFNEQEKEQSYVVKRAGRIQKIVGAGAAHGVFVYGLNLYSWDIGVANTAPTITLLSSM